MDEDRGVEAYEAPAVTERTPVDQPLIGVTSGGVDAAHFRPTTRPPSE